MRTLLGVLVLVLGLSAVPLAAQTPGTAPTQGSGAAVFNDHCATCHSGDDPRTPTVAALRQRSPDDIFAALVGGVMRQQAAGLSDAERKAVAEYLAGRPLSASPASAAGRCVSPSPFDVSSGARWTGWGPSLNNTRYQPAPDAGLAPDQVPALGLKWAFGFPNATSARALPTVAGGRLFVGSADGTVYALDAKLGCTIWTFKARAGVRSAIVIGQPSPNGTVMAYFGDGRAAVYGVNAATGELVWSRTIDEHPSAHVTGAPALYQNRLYISVASGEEGQGNNPRYECCTFRGSLVALNATTGAPVWKTFTIADEPRSLGRNNGGATRWGPSGAGIWSTPTVDPKRRVVYAATGNMYTEPQQGTSDAVMAFDMDSGKIAWTSQVTPKDIFVVGCNQPNPANCPAPDALGPDFDFGNSPMITTVAGGRDLIVIGQKSGVGWALDPDKSGAVVWQYVAGRGSALGGMEFGSAADEERAYFAVADGNMATAGQMHAVRLDTGERAWMTPPPPLKCGERARGCSQAILAAISVIPGALFAGGMDGGMRAYSTRDGAIIWEFDTNREFTTVNGVAARGASINGPGPVVAGGMVYVNSGYGALGGRPGNVLLAFGVE